MAYDGWIEYDGVEVCNLSRTAQLAETLGIDVVWVDPASVAWIQEALEGDDYNLISAAPWYDPGYPASAEFAGVVPLSITGLDDSSRESSVVEYVTDGGSASRGRNASLPIPAKVSIVASTSRGADFGKRWLERRLSKTKAQLRYFQWAGVESPIVHRREVSLTRGCNVVSKRNNSCSHMWAVTYTWTAGDPFEYGEKVNRFRWISGGQTHPIDYSVVAANRVPNPSFEVSTTGWVAGGGSLTRIPSSTTPVIGDYIGSYVAATTTSEQYVSHSLVAIQPSTSYTGSIYVRMQGTSVDYKMQVLWYDASDNVLGAMSKTYIPSSLSGVTFTRMFVTGTAPANATKARVQVSTGTSLPVGAGFHIDGASLVSGNLIDYFDGNGVDTDGHVYHWSGSVNNSLSYHLLAADMISSGSLNMVEESCPVFDYSPIYDPLYPALVTPPTAPDFYPEGWTLVPGAAFTRRWVRVNPLEPDELDTVPVIRITATSSEARMVRLAVWPSDADIDTLCDPLWVAIISYLPAATEMFIDGEMEAVYSRDAATGRIRRMDSLVFGSGAQPIKWNRLNDQNGFLVTLDASTLSLDAYFGLVPKSN